MDGTWLLLTRPNWARKVRELRRREMDREKSENLWRRKILFCVGEEEWRREWRKMSWRRKRRKNVWRKKRRKCHGEGKVEKCHGEGKIGAGWDRWTVIKGSIRGPRGLKKKSHIVLLEILN